MSITNKEMRSNISGSGRTVIVAEAKPLDDGSVEVELFSCGNPFLSIRMLGDIIERISDRAHVSFDEMLDMVREIHNETVRETMDDIIKASKGRRQ